MYMGMSKCRNSSGHGDTDSEGRSPEREKVRQHIDGISALCTKAPKKGSRRLREVLQSRRRPLLGPSLVETTSTFTFKILLKTLF